MVAVLYHCIDHHSDTSDTESLNHDFSRVNYF